MTDAEYLGKIKTGLGITTSYQDELLGVYIDSVKEFMKDAGVPDDVINSDASVGCVLRGVSDLWNYTSGEVKFSEFFKQRVTQLALRR